MNRMLKKLLLLICAVPILVMASGEEVHLDKAPLTTAPYALQHGAKLFINYCLNCHGASFLRYNKLTEIGLSDELIKNNLMFTSDKIGDQMSIAMRREDGKAWFGAAPPDLTLIARARASEHGSGADWLYTYLRGFYRDPSRLTGWNNVVFPNVGMPHVLWELQGEQKADFRSIDDGHGNKKQEFEKFELVKPGKMQAAEYDEAVADLVSFLVWASEPVKAERNHIGFVVLLALSLLLILTYALKRAYWKDIH